MRNIEWNMGKTGDHKGQHGKQWEITCETIDKSWRTLERIGGQWRDIWEFNRETCKTMEDIWKFNSK